MQLEYSKAKEYSFKYQMSEWSTVFQKKLLMNPFVLRPTFNNLCVGFVQSHEFTQEMLFAYYIHTDQIPQAVHLFCSRKFNEDKCFDQFYQYYWPGLIVLKMIAILMGQSKSLADITRIDSRSKVYPPQLRTTEQLTQVRYLVELCQQYFAKALSALEQLILAANAPEKKGLGNHKVVRLDFRQMQRLVGPIQHICAKLFLLILSLQSTKLHASV